MKNMKSNVLQETLTLIGFIATLCLIIFAVLKIGEFVIDVKDLVNLDVKSKLVLLKEDLENKIEHHDRMNDFLLQDSRNLTRRVEKLEGKK